MYLHDKHLGILDGRKSQLISTENTCTVACAADVSGELASIFGTGACRDMCSYCTDRGVPGGRGRGNLPYD